MREDDPCPKLHQHPRSSSPKITHTHLPETKTNIYCIVLLSAVFKIKRSSFFFFFSRDSDCLQLKTQGSLFPSSELPNPHLCTRWAEAAFAKYKAQSTEWEGTGGGREGSTALPAGWRLAAGAAWWHKPKQCLGQGAGGVRGIWRPQERAPLAWTDPETSQGPQPNSAS